MTSPEQPFKSRKIKIQRNYRKTSDDEAVNPKESYQSNCKEDYSRPEKSSATYNNGKDDDDRHKSAINEQDVSDIEKASSKKHKKHKKEHKHNKDKDRDKEKYKDKDREEKYKEKEKSKHKSSKSKYEDREDENGVHKSKHKHKKKNKKKEKDRDKERSNDKEKERSHDKEKERSHDKEKERSYDKDKEKPKLTINYDSSEDWNSDFEEQEKLKKLEKTIQNKKDTAAATSWYKVDESELSRIEGMHLDKNTLADNRNMKDDDEEFKDFNIDEERNNKLSGGTNQSSLADKENDKPHVEIQSSGGKDISMECIDDCNDGGKMQVVLEPSSIALPPSFNPETNRVSKNDVFERASEEQSGKQTSSAAAASKKAPGLKLGLKLSDTSRALISSGVKPEDAKRNNLEEGELTESEDSRSQATPAASCSSSAEEGALSDSDGGDAGASGGRHEEKVISRSRKRSSKHGDSSRRHRQKKKKYSDRSREGSPTEYKRSREKHVRDRSPDSKKEKRSKPPKRHRHSKSRSPTRSRSRSRSPVRARIKKTVDFDKRTGVWRSRSRSRERERRHTRSRSRDRQPRERDNFYASFYGNRSRSRDRDRGRWRSRSRSRSRERRGRERAEDLRLKIDKSKLREIALKNAVANMKAGRGPTVNLKPDEVAALKAGGKSINELTEFCKKIASKDGGGTAVFSSDESGDDKSHLYPNSDEEGGGTGAPFSGHHPFKVSDASGIAINIRNARQLPTSTPVERTIHNAELRLQFPVSSGSHHRAHEPEWVPVEKGATKPSTVAVPAPARPPPTAVPPPTPIPSSMNTVAVIGATEQAPVPEAPVTAAASAAVAAEPDSGGPKIFPDPPPEEINIGDIVSDRLSAIRKLANNPHDVQALNTCYKANKAMTQWAHSKQLPGQFTGTSSGIQPMTQREMATGPQAWARKDQLKTAAPVSQGIGKLLLERMGWKSGEGLGKNKEGTTLPLMLDIKNDRRGLSGADEGNAPKGRSAAPPPTVLKDLSGKHPVSALMEICNKRHWPSPQFNVVNESGPDHKKNFLFKVIVNKVEYQPTCGSSTKKQAKAVAATVCLQALGMIPNN